MCALMCIIEAMTPTTTAGEGLFNFQERILVKFGFIPFHDPTTDNQRQFVHVSGSIFVMIPSKNPASSPYKSARKRGKFLKVCSDHFPKPESHNSLVSGRRPQRQRLQSARRVHHSSLQWLQTRGRVGPN